MPDPCYTLGLEEKVGINHTACCYSSCPRQLTRGNIEKQGEREAVLTTLSAEARETSTPQARQLRPLRGSAQKYRRGHTRGENDGTKTELRKIKFVFLKNLLCIRQYALLHIFISFYSSKNHQ